MFYFRDKSPRKRGGVQSTRSLGRSIKYLRLRDAHHQMWRAIFFKRVERKQTLGRENSKSLGVAMTSDSRRGDSSGDWRPDKRPDTRTRVSILFAICVTINTCILSREPRPTQRGGYYEK